MWLNKIFRPIDNAQLILFRIFFGLVFIFESVGALLTGWARTNTVEPKVNFTFIGFEWLHYLMGPYMYVHFGLMAVASIGVMLGYKYRYSIISLTVLWACVYFMQKTSYNNHYYLMLLICLLMCFLPANKYAAFDIKNKPEKRTYAMPEWIRFLFIFQVSCVYIFATIAKFYPGWLDGSVTAIMFRNMNVPEIVKPMFKSENFHLFIAYTGIAFDGLIIPALLWRRTRWIAIIASLIFHIFNSITLKIGVFPYFALAFSIFFFPPDQIRKFFFRRKPVLTDELSEINYNPYRKTFFGFMLPYMIIQFALPWRHHFFKGDVLWNEEGHRLSWRMMLRSRSGEARFKVVDKNSGETSFFDNSELLNRKQRRRLNTPDMIWQMAQFIKEYYAEKGADVEVYVYRSQVSINSKQSKRLIDSEVDLAAEKWCHFSHHDWILDENDERTLPPKTKIMKSLFDKTYQK